MAFEKGKPRATNAGRVAGTPNKLGTSVKDAFLEAFNLLQENDTVKLSAWGKENPTEFYKLCSKLIPAAIEMKAEVEGVEQVFKIGNVEIKL
jgi:hypothetical protein